MILLWCSTVFAQHPNGTLVLSSADTIVGRTAKRITNGDRYTHIGIVIDGQVYEATLPRAKRGPIASYPSRRSTNDFFEPIHPYSYQEVDRMRRFANSQLGVPYKLRNYFHPRSRPVNGTWCSPFVGRILNASGRHHLSKHQMFEPQNVINTLRNQLRFARRVCH